ncbi:MAG: BamA/TamA family outer membrane protein [Alloprevotella sp.]
MKVAFSTCKSRALCFLYILLYVWWCSASHVSAQTPGDTIIFPAAADSSVLAVNDSAQLSQSKSLWRKLVNYFKNSDKRDDSKNFDFGFLPGPHYSSTVGLGLGLVATATYSADFADKSLPRSNAALYGDMTTEGFFLIGIKGLHIFPRERYKLEYRLNLSTFLTDYYGMGYALNNEDSNKASFRRNRVEAIARFLFRLAPNTYLGPTFSYRFIQAAEIKEKDLPLFENQRKNLHATSPGVTFLYDSRDFIQNASKGAYFQVNQSFTPRFMGNNYCFSSTEVTLSGYQKVWRGGILAGEYHSLFNFGHTPWGLMAEVGDNNRMRGYYEGRYRDQNLIEAQIELRQNIHKRHGMVVWIGAAQIFDQMKDMRFRQTLPNGGIGYRWAFKKGINVRLDYGLSKNGGGFIFSLNEAF